MKKIEIKIKEIYCSGCAGRVYRTLSQFPAIHSSKVNYRSNIVSVIFSEENISEEKIKEMITISGLEVVENV